MTKLTRLTTLAAAATALSAGGLTAQATDLASQTLGRAYWHVFAAYAVGWILVVGWMVVIARRLREVERAVQGD